MSRSWPTVTHHLSLFFFFRIQFLYNLYLFYSHCVTIVTNREAATCLILTRFSFLLFWFFFLLNAFFFLSHSVTTVTDRDTATCLIVTLFFILFVSEIIFQIQPQEWSSDICYHSHQFHLTHFYSIIIPYLSFCCWNIIFSQLFTYFLQKYVIMCKKLKTLL